MTAICPGAGPSQKRPIIGDLFLITGTIAAEIVKAAGGRLSTPLSAATGVFTWNAVDQCTSDPPGFAVFTPAEANALVFMNLGTADFDSGLTKLRGNIMTALWYVNCECITGPQPLQPPYPADPAGTPVVPSEGNGTCSDLTWQGNLQSLTGNESPPQYGSDISASLLPIVGAGVPAAVIGTSNHVTVYPVPQPTQTQIRVLGNWQTFNPDANVNFWFGNPSTVVGTIGNINLPAPGQPHSFDTGLTTWPSTITFNNVTSPVTHYGITVYQRANIATSPGPVSLRVQLIGCSLAGAPCCVDDPAAAGMAQQLQTIQRMIEQLANELLVGDAGLVDSTRHANLSGAGSITLTNVARAVRVEIKNLPAGWPQVVQDPPYLWSAGFITPLAEDVPLRGSRLIYESQTYPLLPITTGIAYTIPAGLVVDIVELLASP